MIKLAVISKHIKGGFYTPGIGTLPFNNVDDCVQALTRDAKMCSASELYKIKDLEQYAIGFFNDISGRLELFDNAEFLIEYGSYYQIARDREVEKEVKKDE